MAALAIATSCGSDEAPAQGGAGSIDGGSDAGVSFDGSASLDAAGAIDSASDARTDARAGDAAVGSGRWVMGYYAGYERDAYPVAAAIEWSGLTHLAVAFYLPRADGTLDESLFIDATSGPALARALVAAAHANGRKAIASVGGAGMHAQWVGATSSGTRATFIGNLRITRPTDLA